MAEQGQDPFDEEMAALRTEVGRFVLRLLNDDAANRDVLSQVGERLAAHVSDKARPVSALNADDRKFLDQLSRRVERLDHDVRRLRASRPVPAGEGDDTGGGPGDAGGDAWVEGEDGAFGTGGFRDLPRWVPWALCGVLGVALAATVAFVVLSPRMAAPPPAVEDEAAVVAPADPDSTWRTVLATVETWPDEERVAARRVLCGSDDAEVVCPSWAERSAELATDAAGRAQVARVIAQALAQAECPAFPQAGGPDDAPTRAVDPSCLIEGPA